MRRMAMLGVLLLSTGCGTSDVVSAGGAGGGAELRFWDAGRGRPVVVLAREVVSHGGRIDDLEFHDVDIRLPLGDRVGSGAELDLACIHAATARLATSGDGQRTINLAGAGDEPVRLAGTLQGRAFVGHARTAHIDTKSRMLVADEIELVRAGAVLRAPRLEAAGGGRIAMPEGVSVNDGPPRSAACIAATAAMPSPFRIPEP